MLLPTLVVQHFDFGVAPEVAIVENAGMETKTPQPAEEEVVVADVPVAAADYRCRRHLDGSFDVVVAGRESDQEHCQYFRRQS